MQIPSAAGLSASAAGAPLSQKAGSSVERAAGDAAAQARTADSDLKADKAAGIGQTEHDEQTSDRDADGRRLWEHPEDAPASDPGDEIVEPPAAVDPTGNRGGQLDLTG